MTRHLLALSLVALALPARAGEPLKADAAIDALLAPVRDKHKLPGLIGAVVQDDKIVACGAAGVRKQGVDAAIDVNDKLHLGSCTKALTATMLATLVEAKKLSWETTLAQAFPDDTNVLHPDLRSATLEELLQMRSGLRPNADFDAKAPGGSTGLLQRRWLFRKVLREAPDAKPGTKAVYSNLGYAVAAMMAETATKEPWEELMRARVFKPLGMTSAGFGPPATKGKVDQPWGHVSTDGKIEPTQTDNPLMLSPATGVHASLTDWARFVSLHLRGPKGEEKLLKAETFKRLHTPPEGSPYAGGWFLIEQPWAKGKALNHAGSNGSWYVVVWAAPTRGLAFLAATNVGGQVGEQGTNDAIAALAGYWLKKLGE